MNRILAIASGKGGADATTLAIALGASLSKLEVMTKLIDANLTTPTVGLHIGSPAVRTCLQDARSIKHPVTYSHPDSPASRTIAQLAQPLINIP